MKYLILPTLFFFALTASASPDTASIIRAVDGDTVVINLDGVEERLRVVGIDTPETVKSGSPVECFGIEASNYAKEILAEGSEITVELQSERDKFDRLLGYIEIDGQDFGARMINEGYAYAFRAFKHERLDDYIRLEQDARNNEAGLWSPTSCAGDPDTESATIIQQEKISFWQNIFRSIAELINLFK